MAIDYTTDVGKVRLLIPDTEEVDWEDDGQAFYIFEDAEIEGYLALNEGRVRLAAADAVEAIAMSEALISKVIKTEDLQTDGAKTANAMLAKAQRLRAEDARQREEENASHVRVVRFRPRPVNQFRRAL